MTIIETFDHPERKQNKEHFVDLIQVAMADGVIEPAELEMLNRFGMRMGLTEPEINSMIEETGKTGFTPPYEFSKRFEQIYNIVKMILADGIIDNNETRLASCFATKLGFTENEIPALLDFLIAGINEGKDEDDLFEAYKKVRKI